VRAWRRQSIAMPWRRAASSTMMFAIDPTMRRFPASVLTSASIGPEKGCVAAGRSSITAGTFETGFDSTRGAANSGAGSRGGEPGSGEPRYGPSGEPGMLERVIHDEQPDEQDQQLPVDESEHVGRVQPAAHQQNSRAGERRDLARPVGEEEHDDQRARHGETLGGLPAIEGRIVRIAPGERPGGGSVSRDGPPLAAH